MSEFKVGDKVFLECEVSEKDKGDNTYRIQYKDWEDEYSATLFVKDKVLHPTDEAYNKGLNDAWELAKKIVLPDYLEGYTGDEIYDIFKKNTYMSVMKTLTAQEALAKVKAYEERNEIRVGDVVKIKGCHKESIVTAFEGQKVYRLYRDGSSNSWANKEDLEKTGEHYDSIDEFMRSADD